MSEANTQGFSESWLELREPADHAARSTAVLDKLVHWRKSHDTLRVMELGAGTGSNLRYLMPALGHDQHWLLMDNDAALLEHLPKLMQQFTDTHHAQLTGNSDCLFVEHANFSARITTRVIDLASQLDQLMQQETHLLTASALLDLTSAAWLDQLASIVHQHQCACLFALNYNGTIDWQPVSESDAAVSNLLNRHQLGEKGFGAALGPAAGSYFADQLQHSNNKVVVESSDWQIDESMAALQLAIIEGWAPAAIEQDSGAAGQIDTWFEQRKAWITEGVSRLSVGHNDVLALP
ncbi:class I SAM-dependent methyltransferase [bacterium]|nr:class I SAM-dependent methyltransferase [bacterium]